MNDYRYRPTLKELVIEPIELLLIEAEAYKQEQSDTKDREEKVLFHQEWRYRNAIAWIEAKHEEQRKADLKEAERLARGEATNNTQPTDNDNNDDLPTY